MVLDRKKRYFSFLFVLIVLLGAFSFFGALYTWDNKYTQNAPQAQDGILPVSKQALAEYPVFYLVDGWELYSGKLLSPQEISSAQPEYTFIGQYSGMEKNDASASPHGSATYRLTLLLPAEKAEYAIGLPEIFSAYRLYINGELLAQNGNPDPSAYESGIQTRTLSFAGSGETEIVIAVTDQAGLYSGMVYPPAFGKLQDMLHVQDAQLLVHLAIVLAALLGTVCSLYFGLRKDRTSGILSCLLCVGMAGISCYPLVHTFWQTGYFPWYPIEIICYSGILLLAVTLQNRLFEISGTAAFFSALPCAAGVAFSAFYSLGAGVWDTSVLHFFSSCVAILKYYTAAYLLAVSVYAIIRQKIGSYVLFGASLIFASTLIFDRLFPLYEPIIGCFFPEAGSFALVLAFEWVLGRKLAAAYRFQTIYEAERVWLERQLSMQKEHYRQLTDQVEKARIATHDLRHHMRILSELAHKNAYDQIEKYLENYAPRLTQQEVVTFTNHQMADAVLNHYASLIHQKGALFDARLILPADLQFPDDEFCILLSNLLENALDAISRQKNGKRYVYLRGEQADGKIRLVMDNSFDGILKKEKGRFLSSKRNGFGTGILSVQSQVRRFGGLASFHADGNVFRVSILIPLKK